MKMTETIQQNAAVLTAELEWLARVIEVRLQLYFKQESDVDSVMQAPVPSVSHVGGTYAHFITENNLNPEERLVLILGLVPHVKPEILDVFFTKNKGYDKRFSEFGGTVSDAHTGMIPTAETALFILAGDNIALRLNYQSIFNSDHLFMNRHVVKLSTRKKEDPLLSRQLQITNEYIEYLTTGKSFQPDFNEDFPAKQIATELDWNDVVLTKKTLESIGEIKDWVEHGHVLMNGLGLGKTLKPGYKALFYGPPGTGKTMTATLLGKSTGKPVYKIDLGMVLSKYIGETEKNLSKIFDIAEKQHWILFFDEADALFGKRTEVKSANDRFGNQEIAYLLQRVEDFPGVIILASNLNENIDMAFTRRFQSMIQFQMPGIAERYQLWTQSFSKKLPLDQSIDMMEIAEKYEISGGLMMNVIRRCSLKAVKHKRSSIPLEDLEESIRMELQKEGIILN